MFFRFFAEHLEKRDAKNGSDIIVTEIPKADKVFMCKYFYESRRVQVK